MSTHRGKRLLDQYGDVNGYEYRDTIIEKTYYADGPSMFVWVISGFGPGGWTEWSKLRDAKAYIDRIKDET